jgi:hypothetical protein
MTTQKGEEKGHHPNLIGSFGADQPIASYRSDRSG